MDLVSLCPVHSIHAHAYSFRRGSKLLPQAARDSIKKDEDESLVTVPGAGATTPQVEKRLSDLDKQAKLEGKCLLRPKLVDIVDNTLVGGTSNQVTLWANYFPVDFNPAKLKGVGKLYKYDVKVDRVDKVSRDTNQQEVGKGKGKQADYDSTGQQGQDNKQKTQVPPRLVEILLLKVLRAIFNVPDYVTDFKESIIFLNEVDFKVSEGTEGKVLEVDPYTGEAQLQIDHSPPGAPNVCHSYQIRFENKKTYDMSSDETVLREDKGVMSVQASARLRDIVSMVICYTLRSDPRIAVVGSNRFFRHDTSQRQHVNTYSMLAILKGFSQNVRPATNRLLVNVNPTYSVFRPRINIGRWIRMWEHEREWSAYEGRKIQDLTLLHKMLSKTKVLYMDPAAVKPTSDPNSPTYSDASEFDLHLEHNEEVEFFIAGLARISDGCKCSCEGKGVCCKCRNHTGPGGHGAATRCDEECQNNKLSKGFAINADFATEKEAYFKCGLHVDEKDKKGKKGEEGANGKKCPLTTVTTAEKTKLKGFHCVNTCLEKAHGNRKDHTAYKFKYEGIPLINRGTPADPNYIPAERCWIVFGQRLLTNVDETACEQLMMKFACRRPYDNAHAICTEGYEVLRLDSNPMLSRLGITIGKNLVTVEGRLLTPPELSYGQNKRLSVSDGAWNIKGTKLLTPCSRKPSWTYIVLRDGQTNNDSAIKSGMEEFEKQLRDRLGVSNAAPESEDGDRVDFTGANREKCLLDLSDKMDQLKKKVKLVVIIFPVVQPLAVYNKIKFLADVVHGIHTCCTISSNFLKKKSTEVNSDYFANVVLKFNLKLGGANHELQPNQSSGLLDIGGTMVVGYDVIHPTGTQSRDMCSHVGFVSSIKAKSLSQWKGYHWGQAARQEILDSKLQEAFLSSARSWAAHNNKFPDKVIIFRDGVSESQYETVINEELSLIQKARVEENPEWTPKITLVVSVKRHSTRFFPTDSGSMNGKSLNIKAGTVVDRSVTQARYWEFFLTAQDAIKGTARPTRYVVIHDEIFRRQSPQRAASMLEDYTHRLCYMFGRATKAVRLCTPAYYADILCTRARAYESVQKDSRFVDNVLEREKQGKRSKSEDEKKRIKKAEIQTDIKDSMFWI